MKTWSKHESAATYIFYNISLNVPRPIFFKIYCLPFSGTPNIRKIKVKAGLKNNYFSYFMSFCINRIAIFNNLLALIRGQTTGLKKRARNFLIFKYFLINLLLKKQIISCKLHFQNSSSYWNNKKKKWKTHC